MREDPPQDSLRTIQFDDSAINAIFVHLEADSDSGQEQRVAERFAYRAKTIIVQLIKPQAGGQSRFTCPTQNISKTGLACLHGGVLAPGTPCIIHLATIRRTWYRVNATVVRCRPVQGKIHDLGLRFDSPIDPTAFCLAAVRLSVLLVEPNRELSKQCQVLLSDLAVDVEVLEQGAPVSSKIMINLYDLVLLEMDDPTLDGVATVRRLRDWGYLGTIVGVTRIASAGDRSRPLDAGCDQVLPKPFNRRDLMALLQAHGRDPVYSEHQGDAGAIPLIQTFVRELTSKVREAEESLARKDLARLDKLTTWFKNEAEAAGFDSISKAGELLLDGLRHGLPIEDLRSEVEDLVKLCSQVRF